METWFSGLQSGLIWMKAGNLRVTQGLVRTSGLFGLQQLSLKLHVNHEGLGLERLDKT
jgi:hypothetical protein